MTTRTPEQAIHWTTTRGGIPGGAGWCKRETRSAYGVPSDGSSDASEAWRRTKHRHTGTAPPRGAIVWWTGGRSGHGHVAISLGDGRIRTTDLPTSGRWGTAQLSDPVRLWGLRYEGWSEDIDGVRVFFLPKPKPKPSRIANLRARLRDVARTAPTKRRRAAAAAAAAALKGFK